MNLLGRAVSYIREAFTAPGALTEATSLDSRWIGPCSPFNDDGEQWLPLGMSLDAEARAGFRTEQELAEARRISRYIAAASPHAINVQKNLGNFVVACGHTYKPTAKPDQNPSKADLAAVAEFLETLFKLNNWRARQKESVRRIPRDGEFFRRIFRHEDGYMRFRFIEPGQVSTPIDRTADPDCSMGIQNQPGDVETPIAYFVDGETVPADEVQHHKPTVDLNVKRGAPLFYVISERLMDGKGIMAGMAKGAKILSCVAFQKVIKDGSAAAVVQSRSNATDYTRTNSMTGKTENYQEFKPGKILTTSDAVEIKVPLAGVNYATFVEVIACHLREFAAMMNMPEAMLTADSSNMAAYSAAMVAESPSVREFESQQYDLIELDKELIQKAIAYAVEYRLLPASVLDTIEVQIEGPSIEVRNLDQEGQLYEREARNGVLSVQTWSGLRGYDYEQEQKNIEDHIERMPEAGLPALGEDDPEEEGGDKGEDKPRDKAKDKGDAADADKD